MGRSSHQRDLSGKLMKNVAMVARAPVIRDEIMLMAKTVSCIRSANCGRTPWLMVMRPMMAAAIKASRWRAARVDAGA